MSMYYNPSPSAFQFSVKKKKKKIIGKYLKVFTSEE